MSEPTAGEVRAIVLSGTGGVWRVRTMAGEEHEASMRGRLKKGAAGLRSDGSRRRDTKQIGQGDLLKLAVGDEVLLERDATDSAWTIAEILPRRSRLARRMPGGGHGERVVAANVDQMIVVFAAAKPDPHPRMLDRFLVIAEGNDLEARIVINKADLVGGGEKALAPWRDYERAGYPLHTTSTKTGEGIEELRAVLDGRTSAVTGPSGVGKSSLMNALFPGLGLRVGEISESVNKGRHTTVGAWLHPLPGDRSYVVDTPGLREVGLWGLEPDGLDRLFREFVPLVPECRFADCTHRAEPECAVRAAVGGAVSAARYDSYLRLREELEAEGPSW